MMVHLKIETKTVLIGILISKIILCLPGCYYDVEDILYPPSTLCDSTDYTYSGAILPIIQSNCYECHDVTTGLGNVILEPHESIQSYALDGSLYCTVSHGEGCSSMPKNDAKLLDCQIELIKKWIDEGALEN